MIVEMAEVLADCSKPPGSLHQKITGLQLRKLALQCVSIQTNLHIVLFKHSQYLQGRACARTALEISK